MKEVLRKLTPLFLRRARRDLLQRRQWKFLDKLSTKEVFQYIYENEVWGASGNSNDRFFSGGGSHTQEFVEVYIAALEKFLRALPEKPVAVDLGCGDFAVGSKIRPLCDVYVACDIVDSLIRRNRERFKSLDVDFRVLDITTDSLPEGQVVFIRQVFQHLSNSQIQSAIEKIAGNYQYLVLTEHVPASTRFTSNLDKPAGPHTRLDCGGNPSGVVLTDPPFNLKVLRSSDLCEVRDNLGRIRTTLYEFE